jgi:hypothetical protein
MTIQRLNEDEQSKNKFFEKLNTENQ